MSHRTQITLTDEQYATLRRESARSGMSLSELVRRAVSRAYGPDEHDEAAWKEALEATFGLWKDRDFDGAEYVRRIRGPGLGHRLAKLDHRR